MRIIITSLVLWVSAMPLLAADTASLQVATFRADVTPPLGSPLCNGNVVPVMDIVTPLTARGVVLLGAGDPVVLCAFDWVGIGNEGYDEFREALGVAFGTNAERVAVHTLHQHDAPGSDFATERLLTSHGLARQYSKPDFDVDVMQRVTAAARQSLDTAQPVTHIGLGNGQVSKVASNRRILGPDGRVILQRQSSCVIPEDQDQRFPVGNSRQVFPALVYCGDQ